MHSRTLHIEYNVIKVFCGNVKAFHIHFMRMHISLLQQVSTVSANARRIYFIFIYLFIIVILWI